MSWINHKNLKRALVIVIMCVAGLFVFVMVVKEEKLEINPELANKQPDIKTQVTEILKELKKPAATDSVALLKKIVIDLSVPFVSQAPLGNWSDARQQDACEEASVLMAMAWVKGEKIDPAEAEKTLMAMSDWQLEHYGNFVDTNAEDTAERLFKKYYQYDKFTVVELTAVKQIIDALSQGQLVVLPTNGRKLKNPYYTQPGPLTHMIVVKGYDPASEEFITHDPGTKRGANYRYTAATIFAAAYNYPTGQHEATEAETKAMIIVSK